MKPEDRKRLKQHIEMVVDHKTSAEELQEENRKLRLELHTLRFKESQEQRFIWWIWNVYAKNVQDLLTAINESVIDGADSIWSFVNNLRDYTEKIYDGTYLDVEMSVDVNEPSNSDISVTQNVLMDIKTSSDNNKLHELLNDACLTISQNDYAYEIDRQQMESQIENLKKENEKLRNTLRQISEMSGFPVGDQTNYFERIAKEALSDAEIEELGAREAEVKE